MKILVISQYYRPDITAAAFRIAETADLLAEMGHDVSVVTSEPHRAQASGDRNPGAGEVPAEGINPTIHRVAIDPLSGGGMRPYLRHFFSFVLRARRRARRLFRDGYRPDVIWVSSPPLFVGLIGTAAARWSGAPMVLDIRDVWPDTAVAAGQISREGRAYKVGRFLEHWLYRKAAAFSCVAEPMAEYLRDETGGSPERAETAGDATVDAPQSFTQPIEVVYNGAGFDVVEPVPAEDVQRTVLYAGNLGRLQGIGALLQAWAALVKGESTPDCAPDSAEQAAPAAGWTLEIIGGGVLEEELRRQVNELGIGESVRFRGVMAKGDTVREMARAGILFLNLISRPVFDLTIPSKLFDYLAVGRPIVGGISGEGKMILEKTPGNRAVTPDNSDSIAAALREIMSGDEWRSSLPENQRLAGDRYSRRANAAVLERLLTRVARL